MVYINPYERFEWDGAIYNTELLVVDLGVLAMFIAVMTHAFIHTQSDGLVLIATTLCIGVISELTSVYLVSTFCHAEALVMIGQCCSLNSILYYVGWMYSCYAIGNRVPLQSKFARNLLVATMHPLFSLMYELVGFNSGWIKWGQVPVSSVQATFSSLLGGITGNSDTAFMKMTEASLNIKILGVPVITVMFQFFFGVAFHWCRSLAKMIVEPRTRKKDRSKTNSNAATTAVNARRSIIVSLTNAATEVFVVATLAPLVALVPSFLLIKLVVGSNSILASNWAGGYFSFLDPLFTGKNSDMWLPTASASILIASLTAVFADPIFRKVNIHNISSFSNNANLLVHAVPQNKGVPVLKQLYQAYRALLGKDNDRDLVLLSIPYVFFGSLVGIVFRQMYVDYTAGKALVAVFLPYRVAALLVANAGFWLFGYFNFSELEWKVVQKGNLKKGASVVSDERMNIFNSMSPNRVLKQFPKEGNNNVVNSSSIDRKNVVSLMNELDDVDENYSISSMSSIPSSPGTSRGSSLPVSPDLNKQIPVVRTNSGVSTDSMHSVQSNQSNSSRTSTGSSGKKGGKRR
jgi:hypothetical protein